MKFPVWPQKGGGGLIPPKTSYIPVYQEPGIGMQNGDLETYLENFLLGGRGGGFGRDRFGSIAKICQAGGPPYWVLVQNVASCNVNVT